MLRPMWLVDIVMTRGLQQQIHRLDVKTSKKLEPFPLSTPLQLMPGRDIPPLGNMSPPKVMYPFRF
jgi:hypothetical protein